MKRNTAYSFLCCYFWTSIDLCLGQSCSRSLPIYNSSSFAGGNFTSNGGIQLLLPSSNFTCQGIITQWSAHVTGDTSVSNSIEFQIFEPTIDEANGNDLYRLKYGNPYLGNNAQDSMITRPVNAISGPVIPVRPGDIVGIYLPPSVAGLKLLYEYGGENDVLYWNNIGNTTCNYSLCSGNVITGLDLLVGWEFMPSSITTFENTLSLFIQSNPHFCQGSVVECVMHDLSSVTTSSSVAISSLYYGYSPTTSILSASNTGYTTTTITTSTKTTIKISTTTITSSTTTTVASSETPLDLIIIAIIISVIMFLMCMIFFLASFLYVVIMKNKRVNITVPEPNKHDNNIVVEPTTNPAYNIVTVHSHTVYDEIEHTSHLDSHTVYDEIGQTLHSDSPVDITSQPNAAYHVVVGQESNRIASGPDDPSDEENYYY